MNWKICGIHELPEMLPWASHVLSISSPDSRHEVPPLPGSPVKVLRIDMDDVEFVPRSLSAEMPENFSPPDAHLIQDIIEFGKSVPEDGTLLIHCQMGISRSTAATLAILVARDSLTPPAVFLKQIEASREIVMPNRLIIKLADQQLQKKGKLIQCVDHHWKTQSEKWRR